MEVNTTQAKKLVQPPEKKTQKPVEKNGNVLRKQMQTH